MGVKPMCPLYGVKWKAPAQGCWQYYSAIGGNPSMVTDRESVINLHMGIPKHNGLRDDVQVLWSGSALNNYGYGSPSDLGPGNNQFIYSLYNTKAAPPVCGPERIAPGLTVNGCTSSGQVISLLPLGFVCGKSPPSYPTFGCAPTYLGYSDAITYNVPFGTPIARSMSNVKPPTPYYAPGAPPHAFDGPIPIYDDSINSTQNDVGITKMQYTYALSQAAYLRLYGYTLYSDFFATAPGYGGSGGLTPSFAGANYQLITHTSGGALDFQDQLNDQNLISVDGNYTTANGMNFNNYTAYGGTSTIGYMAKRGNGYACYDPTTGLSQVCLTDSYYDVTTKNNVTPTWVSNAIAGPAGFAHSGTPAVRAGATWDTLWDGNANGSYTAIRTRFYNESLSDEFRPSDRFLLNAAVRYDNFTLSCRIR
jgi:hypothetical protein